MSGDAEGGELDRLRAEIAELRAQIASQAARANGEQAVDSSDARGHEEGPRERLSREAHQVLANAETDLGDLKDQIERNPLISLLAAFCIGLMIGRGSGR